MPTYRTAVHKTSDIAAAPEHLSAKQIADVRAADLKLRIKELKRAAQDEIEKARATAKKQAAADKAALKERSSPKARKKLEEGRKKAIRRARIQAEYDIYKEIMVKIAAGSGWTCTAAEASKRAQSFAEHVVKRSPPGHADVGYIGGDNGYDPVGAYQGVGGFAP
jgi:4-alpha-glucanotransferase